MKICRIPRCAWYTFTEVEFMFRQKNQLFPEELYTVLTRLGYDSPYAFSIVQKEIDYAYRTYMKKLEEEIDRECPFT